MKFAVFERNLAFSETAVGKINVTVAEKYVAHVQIAVSKTG